MHLDRAGLPELNRDNPRARVSAEKDLVFLKFHIERFRDSRGMTNCRQVRRLPLSKRQPRRLPFNAVGCNKSAMKIRSLSILFGLILLVRFAFGEEMPVEKAAESELPSLLAIYKDIHSHPELSGQEQRTAALVAKELRAAIQTLPIAVGQ